MRRVLVILVLMIVAVTVGARAEDKPAVAVAAAEQLTIVDITDSAAYGGLQAGELVRIVGSTPSGGNISISIDGPGRLAWEVTVSLVKNGKIQLGEFRKEFVIRRAVIEHGPVKATVKYVPRFGEPTTTTYEFEWK